MSSREPQLEVLPPIPLRGLLVGDAVFSHVPDGMQVAAPKQGGELLTWNLSKEVVALGSNSGRPASALRL